MARTVYRKLEIEGYSAEVFKDEIVVHALGRGYDQRDDRNYEVALRIPREDVDRVCAFLAEACRAAGEMQ